MSLRRGRWVMWLAAAAAVAVGCGCGAAPPPGSSQQEVEPRFAGTGSHHRAVATSSPETQVYFDQGLAFLFAFNHDEAVRSFRRAVELDPECAMAYWGIAYARGPHINNSDVPAAKEAEAFEATAMAARLADGLPDDADRALIGALQARYASPPPADRQALDEAFASAMGEVYRRFPEDGDVGALYAEALMDVHPWDLWTHDGEPRAWTPAIVSLLEDVIAAHPQHPLALHLYIHSVEASADPGRGDVAADRLRDLMPGMGHMVHMPSHLDVRRGRWHQAIEANSKAIEADRAYRAAATVPPDFYRLYMAHNHHMKAYAAMMVGQGAVAEAAIRELVADMPADWLEQNAYWADGFVAMPYEVLMRFGKWQQILDEPEPPAYLPLTRAMRQAARAVALAALNRPAEARVEQVRFLELRGSVPDDAPFGNNRAQDLLAVADRLVEGEILYREGAKQAGIEVLYEAAAREDALTYDEPPDWIQPIRHALGATLLQDGRWADAEAVYRADLAKLPENGWSLFGLARALRLQDKDEEAAAMEARFEQMWQGADTVLHSSCFCQPGV